MPARPKRPQKRKRRLDALDTAEGKKEAQDASQWWADFHRRLGKDFRKALIEPGIPTESDGSRNEVDRMMLLTRFLPGYADARQSAEDALLILYGRTPMVREMYRAAQTHGDETMEFSNEVLLALAAYGGGQHGPALPFAERWHEGRGSRRVFARSLGVRQSNAARKPLPNFQRAPVADVPTPALTVTRLWVAAGFWLASDEDTAAVLNRRSIQPGRGFGTVTFTGNGMTQAISALGLKRYGEKGRLVFDDGGLRANAPLVEELEGARQRAHEEQEKS